MICRYSKWCAKTKNSMQFWFWKSKSNRIKTFSWDWEFQFSKKLIKISSFSVNVDFLLQVNLYLKYLSFKFQRALIISFLNLTDVWRCSTLIAISFTLEPWQFKFIFWSELEWFFRNGARSKKLEIEIE